MRFTFPALALTMIMLITACSSNPTDEIQEVDDPIGMPKPEEPEVETPVEDNAPDLDMHNINDFWTLFTQRVAEPDPEGVRELFNLPMKDVDWLVEEAEGGVMSHVVFQDKYGTLFDSTAVAQIPQIKVEDLRKLDPGYEIMGFTFKNGYEFSVNYNYGEMESSMIFFIDEFDEGFRVCYLTVAG